MRGWVLVLAVLATFQAIVQVASTDPEAAAMKINRNNRSKHHRHRTSSWASASSSPTLSFAAIVAVPAAETGLSLTNLNNIVINSDNVKPPAPPQQRSEENEVVVVAGVPQLLVPTNSSASVPSPSANSSVVSSNTESSSLSNLISSSSSRSSDSSQQIASAERSKRRRHRKKGHRRLQQQQQRRRTRKNRVTSNSVQLDETDEEVRRRTPSNELNAEEVTVENEDEEDDVAAEEQEQEEEEHVERIKPDAETLVHIEKNLLSLFGFKKRPKVDRSKVVIPEAMRRMYAEQTGMELDLPDLPKPAFHRPHHTANTVRSFTHEESKIDHRFVHHHRFRLHFNTSNVPADELLKAAELVLSRDAVPEADLVRHRVQVYDIVRPGVKGRREGKFQLIDTKVVNVNTSDNLILDVTAAMDRWQREPKQNHGLLVHVSTVGRHGVKRVTRSTGDSDSDQHQHHQGEDEIEAPEHHHVRLRRSPRDTEEAWGQKQPLLFAYTDDKRHRQSRAAKDGAGGGGGKGRSRNRAKKRPRGICQRHALWVDFVDVGWNDWIVAPGGYDAYYCKGECRIPMADHLNATNHAVVQSLVNSINGSLAPRACCVPTSLTTISLLYLDDQNKVVLKKYQDMVVVGCGCR